MPDTAAQSNLYTRRINPGRVALLAHFYGHAPLIDGRDGVRFHNAADDRWYLNCHCNGGIFNLGHQPEQTRRALLAALDAGLDVGNAWLPSEIKGRLADRLAATTDGRLGGAFFATSGGEAIDVAIKLARRHTRRPNVVSIEGGYHGHTGLATATGTAEFQRPWRYRLPDFVRVRWGDVDALDAAVDDRTSLVLLETIPATLGLPNAPDDWLPTARRLTAERGALLALDEVQTGLGRSGRHWCYQHHDGLDPDLIITGKGLGGGLYPMAATLVRDDLLEVLSENTFAQFASFAGSDLGCAVGLAVLDVLDEPGFLDRVRRSGDTLSAGLVGLPLELRGRGLFRGLATGRENGGIALAQRLFAHGVWVVPAGNDLSVCQLLPPLVIGRDDLAFLVDAIRRSAEEI
ncbi:aspartate aminotransferase family protein [Mycobacterium sp. ML4]